MAGTRLTPDTWASLGVDETGMRAIMWAKDAPAPVVTPVRASGGGGFTPTHKTPPKNTTTPIMSKTLPQPRRPVSAPAYKKPAGGASARPSTAGPGRRTRATVNNAGSTSAASRRRDRSPTAESKSSERKSEGSEVPPWAEGTITKDKQSQPAWEDALDTAEWRRTVGGPLREVESEDDSSSDSASEELVDEYIESEISEVPRRRRRSRRRKRKVTKGTRNERDKRAHVQSLANNTVKAREVNRLLDQVNRLRAELDGLLHERQSLASDYGKLRDELVASAKEQEHMDPEAAHFAEHARKLKLLEDEHEKLQGDLVMARGDGAIMDRILQRSRDIGVNLKGALAQQAERVQVEERELKTLQAGVAEWDSAEARAKTQLELHRKRLRDHTRLLRERYSEKEAHIRASESLRELRILVEKNRRQFEKEFDLAAKRREQRELEKQLKAPKVVQARVSARQTARNLAMEEEKLTTVQTIHKKIHEGTGVSDIREVIDVLGTADRTVHSIQRLSATGLRKATLLQQEAVKLEEEVAKARIESEEQAEAARAEAQEAENELTTKKRSLRRIAEQRTYVTDQLRIVTHGVGFLVERLVDLTLPKRAPRAKKGVKGVNPRGEVVHVTTDNATTAAAQVQHKIKRLLRRIPMSVITLLSLTTEYSGPAKQMVTPALTLPKEETHRSTPKKDRGHRGRNDYEDSTDEDDDGGVSVGGNSSMLPGFASMDGGDGHLNREAVKEREKRVVQFAKRLKKKMEVTEMRNNSTGGDVDAKIREKLTMFANGGRGKTTKAKARRVERHTAASKARARGASSRLLVDPLSTPLLAANPTTTVPPLDVKPVQEGFEEEEGVEYPFLANLRQRDAARGAATMKSARRMKSGSRPNRPDSPPAVIPLPGASPRGRSGSKELMSTPFTTHHGPSTPRGTPKPHAPTTPRSSRAALTPRSSFIKIATPRAISKRSSSQLSKSFTPPIRPSSASTARGLMATPTRQSSIVEANEEPEIAEVPWFFEAPPQKTGPPRPSPLIARYKSSMASSSFASLDMTPRRKSKKGRSPPTRPKSPLRRAHR